MEAKRNIRKDHHVQLCIKKRQLYALATLGIFCVGTNLINVWAFQNIQKPNRYYYDSIPNHYHQCGGLPLSPLHQITLCSTAAGKGFAKIEDKQQQKEEEKAEILKQETMALSVPELKSRLIELIPKMTGTNMEFRLVEAYVNALEDKFIPPQTLGFLNLAISGDWQFLFTTNQIGNPSKSLRLTELIQTVETDEFGGQVSNKATWDLAEDGAIFDARGTLSAIHSYKINQGARMSIDSDDVELKIELARGSSLPKDPQALVGLIYRAMPKELFNSTELAMDTTYLDTDLKIVRWTGIRHEGVRNIFMRSGSLTIDPSSQL